MNVALPEIDGRLFGTVAGFKEDDKLLPELQFSVKRLAPDLSQIAHIAEWALGWARLRELQNAEKKVAVILSNYPNHDGRIGNGVGLDTPASTLNLLRAVRAEGYLVEPVPESGEELMKWLQGGIPTIGKIPMASHAARRSTASGLNRSSKHCRQNAGKSWTRIGS